MFTMLYMKNLFLFRVHRLNIFATSIYDLNLLIEVETSVISLKSSTALKSLEVNKFCLDRVCSVCFLNIQYLKPVYNSKLFSANSLEDSGRIDYIFLNTEIFQLLFVKKSFYHVLTVHTICRVKIL